MKRFWWILFLLLIPTQLGKHFWFEWSTIQGIRSDYLSPTLYLIDIVWIILVILNLPKSLFDKRDFKKYLLLFFLIFINILVAGNKWVAGYEWIRILQWITTIKLITNDKLRITDYLKWIVPVWIVGESLLGLAQIINNGSLQGIFYWLGERRFSLTTVGIAQMSWLGESIVRAYGTFSHPNSLAGFLLLVWYWWQGQNPSALRAAPLDKGATKEVWYWMVWWTGLMGIIISGSRIVWLLTLGLLVIKWGKSWWKYGIIVAGVVMMILGVVGDNYRIADFVGGWDTASLSKRWTLNVEAITMIKNHPLFGVGAGNMVVQEFRWRQPVHNIFLLVIAELGMIPVVILFFNLPKFLFNKRDFILVLAIILITGMVDHYWVTLPQNRWLIAVLIPLNLPPPRRIFDLTRETLKKLG
ncbi:MAG: O-antigen ligase family protein [Candidatus Shapirobacteria bacterium]|nr:O-antigen ligase family protein [Candidatus Shapirobacteria bacterium]